MKRRVKARIDGAKDADVKVAGGSITTNAQQGPSAPGQETEVDVEAKNLDGGSYQFAGESIVSETDQEALQLLERYEAGRRSLDRYRERGDADPKLKREWLSYARQYFEWVYERDKGFRDVERLLRLVTEESDRQHRRLRFEQRSAENAVSGMVAGASWAERGVDFVLVTALPEERDAVLGKLPGYRQLPPVPEYIHAAYEAGLPVEFPDGSAGAYRLIVLPLLDMGRVQAATATAAAITRWRPRYILLVGIAGGVSARRVQIGDLLIANQVVDYELQKIRPEGPEVRWRVHPTDPRMLSACSGYLGEGWMELLHVKRPGRGQPARHTGPIASGDKVIAFADLLDRHREVWAKLIGVEMEAAGVATAAFQSSERPGFFMVRCASDLADQAKDTSGVDKWRDYACDVAAAFSIALLKSGPVPC